MKIKTYRAVIVNNGHKVTMLVGGYNKKSVKKEINNLINNENIKKYKIKNEEKVSPDYTKKIKKLLDLNKPKKELIDTLVDKIVIDKDKNINIYFKYDVIPVVLFKYENRNLARNPYGRKGKKLDF